MGFRAGERETGQVYGLMMKLERLRGRQVQGHSKGKAPLSSFNNSIHHSRN